MATVRKREWIYKGEAKSAWVVTYYDQKGKQRLKTFKLKKAADDFRQTTEAEIAGGVHVADRETVTLKHAVTEWLADCRRRWQIGNLAGNTVRGYENWALNHVIPDLGPMKLNRVTSEFLQEYINGKAEKLARSSCKHILSVLYESMMFAVRKKWLRRNPMVDQPVQVPELASVKQIDCPSQNDLRRILETLLNRRPYEHQRARANRIIAVILGLFCGMRRGEIFGLQWGSVDFEKGIIYVRHSLSRVDGLKGPKTKAGNRRVTMSAPVRAVLLETRATFPKDGDGYVVRSKNGGPITNDHPFTYGWKKLMKAAGLMRDDGNPKYTMHTLRHANVSLLIEKGLQPFLIKTHVGHSRIATTVDTYGHMFAENDATTRAVEGLGVQFGSLVPINAPVKARPTSKAEWEACKAEAEELLAAGVTPIDVARQLSVSFASVYNWIEDRKISIKANAATTRQRQRPVAA